MNRAARAIASMSTAREAGASLLAFGRDIKLAHSVFALPFAVAALFLAPIIFPDVRQWLLLLICMVCARCFAMGINRTLDADIDTMNPRTQNRMIPQGRLDRRQSMLWSWMFGAIFIVAAFGLNLTAGYLSVPLLMVLAGYSVTKRFTWLCHWYLGFCLGFAPVAVYIALGYQPPIAVVLLGIGVAAWTAGFDIIYSLQDINFDRTRKLHSIPAVYGAKKALLISRLNFLVMIVCLLLAGYFAATGIVYYLGVLSVATILAYEHWLVRDAAFSKDGGSTNINAAFFNLNALVSFFFLLFVFIDALVRIYV